MATVADSALRSYYERVLDQLRRVVQELRGLRDGSMRTSDVVQDLCLRLLPQLRRREGPAELVPLAATAARRLLIDAARKRQRRNERLLPPDVLQDASRALCDATGVGLADLHEYLESLGERAARVVDLRLFAGLSRAEIARAAGESEHFVRETLRAAALHLERLTRTEP